MNLPSDWWTVPFTPSLKQGLLKIHNICYQKAVTSRDSILRSVFTLVPSKAFMEIIAVYSAITDTIVRLNPAFLYLTARWSWLIKSFTLIRSSCLFPGPTSFAGFSPTLPYGACHVSRRVGERTWERSWPWPSFMNHPYTCLLACNCLRQHTVPGRVHSSLRRTAEY